MVKPHSEMANLTLLMTSEQAAKALSISTRTLYNLEKEGRLAPVRFGTLKRYRLTDLQNFVNGTAREINV